MTPSDLEHETRLQALALRPKQATAGLDAADRHAVAAYRRVHVAVRAAPIAEPPPGFAMRVARLAEDAGDDAVVERWLQRIMLACALVAVLVYTVPTVLTVMQGLLGDLSLPWPMLAAATLVLAVVGAVDPLLQRVRDRPPIAG